ILCLSLYPGDALVRLPNSPVEASVGIGLHILDGGFGFRQQLVEKTIALTFELIYPILGLLQLSRELVCQCHRAVAILVRQVRRLLQIRNKGRISRIGIQAPKLLSRSDGLLAHRCRLSKYEPPKLEKQNSGELNQRDS